MQTPEKRLPMFTNRALVGLSVPIILNALFAIAAGLVDSAMVSSAGESAVSAVSLVDALNMLFIAAFSSTAIGGSVVVAQYIGSRNARQACVSANQLFYAVTCIATVLMGALLCFGEPLLRLVYGNVETDVFEQMKTYFFFVLLGFPFFAMGEASCAVLRAMGRNTQSTIINVVYNLLNVAGNAILIYGFRLGVAGAAISTTCSRAVYAALGLILTHRKSLPAHFEKLLRFRLDKDVMKRVLRVGLANGMEGSLFHVGKILVASLISSFGTIAIAANSVANNINMIGWTVVNAFGTVLLTVVGQCVGAGETEQAKRYTKKMIGAATVTMVVLYGGIFLLRNQLVLLYDFESEALEAAAYYTGVLALIAMGSLYSFAFVPLSAFRAAGDVRYAVTIAVTSMFAFRVGLCYVLNALFPGLQLMGIFIGMGVDWIVRTVMNIWRYRSGKWLHKRLI